MKSENQNRKPTTPVINVTVFLKGPRSLNYGEVAKVIDVMKFAGCAPIGLQIENLDQ